MHIMSKPDLPDSHDEEVERIGKLRLGKELESLGSLANVGGLPWEPIGFTPVPLRLARFCMAGKSIP